MAAQFFFEGPETIGAPLAKALEEAGFELATAWTEADFIFTFRPLLSALEDAYFDAQGYLAQAKKGAYLVDLSPATPELVREISAIASVSDLHYVEAPLAVNDLAASDAFAQPANLWCAVAGDKPDVKAVRNALQHFVESIRVMDEVGAPQLAHAAWTLQQTAQLFSAVESEALYRAMLRIPTFASVSAAGAPPALNKTQADLVSAITEKSFAGAYTVEMLMADLSAALTIASALDLTLPQAETCMSLLETLAIIGGSDMSPVALSLVYDEEEAAGAQGLDWARSQEYINELGAHDQGHHHVDHAHGEEDAGDFEDFEDFEDFDDGEPFNEDFLDSADDDSDDDDDFGGYADLLNRRADT